MAEQHHNFNVSSSFDQRLSLVVFASVCLTSFLIWPYFDNLLYQVFKYVLLTACLVFFIYQFWRLNRWTCKFSLVSTGDGRVIYPTVNQLNSDCDEAYFEKFTLIKKPVVTPFVVQFYIQIEEGNRSSKRMMFVWADMLDDTSYRNLCRLLLNYNR
ncbi:hypothetical protein FS418_07300 [Shewanella sp. YLB-09]|uniref:Uncharacterized protein n=1 Tax=Shewanella eurypsychrophilus TaxID=2593656 RepID=A0A550ADI8_9GAMM|nr:MULTISPECIES: protein YgfX [Shewanella]QFU21695.1 hypothetical protein FS418_07300 [Shewanella sp. YLB-09]